MDTRILRWGIVGAGHIAEVFARGLAESRTGRLEAVASRSRDKAEQFIARVGSARAHGSYEALLADGEVDAVYIALPHPLHAEWAVKTAEAGKHILCEKPLGLNHAEAMAIVEAARRHDVFLMEAFMYRCHPQVQRLAELLRDGAIGQVRLIRATYAFQAEFRPDSRLFANDLGGGGILDVGCYCVSVARMVAGLAAGSTFAEPLELGGCAHLGSTGVDEWAIASLRFEGDVLAQLSTGVSLQQDNGVHIFGSGGSLHLPSLFVGSGPGRLILRRPGQDEQEIVVQSPVSSYALQADTVAACLDRREPAFPAMDLADSLGNMKTLDRWREAIGLTYHAERLDATVPPVHRRPLTVRKDAAMRYGTVPGLDKRVSRIVMGSDHLRGLPLTAVLFDDFFERGGNAFDTAHIYGGGLSEKLLGRWIAQRKLREQVVILGKGAHTPHCNPEALERQLLESLDRLGTEYLDIYMLHRDNPQVPVEEFLDVLNEHHRAGRIRAFGASNWTPQRIDAANACAARRGQQGFVAMSNNFALARMVEAPWSGCLAASDPDSRAWLERTGLVLMPWSAQAQGFFAGRAEPNDRSDPEMVRCWYAQDNFQRLDRARELAARLGVPTPAVALAYVLCQPFPTFPIIGPRTLDQTRTSLAALDIELTEQQRKWLNLQA